MIIKSKFLGQIEIEENQTITFEEGLPGFEEYKEYVILPLGEDTIFLTLQSIEEEKIGFIILSPFAFRKEYEIELTQEVEKQLQIQSTEDILLYSIAVIPETINKMTANLKAPVVINDRVRKGKQIVLESEEYSMRHYVMEEMESFQDGKEGT